MKELSIEEWNNILKYKEYREPIYYMSKRGMELLDKAITEYAKANNIIITNDKTTNSK